MIDRPTATMGLYEVIRGPETGEYLTIDMDGFRHRGSAIILRGDGAPLSRFGVQWHDVTLREELNLVQGDQVELEIPGNSYGPRTRAKLTCTTGQAHALNKGMGITIKDFHLTIYPHFIRRISRINTPFMQWRYNDLSGSLSTSSNTASISFPSNSSANAATPLSPEDPLDKYHQDPIVVTQQESNTIITA